MLLIFYGGTGYVGHGSRRYFEEKGFEIIEKINYLPDGHILKARYEPRKLATLEEVKGCDFVYEHPDGITMGFNQAQIMDAVWGNKNCLITFSTEDMEFVEQMKASYDGAVTVIGIYIEEHILKQIFSSMDNITQEELNVRMQIGGYIKRNLSKKRDFFDDIVIYNGEDAEFNMKSLYEQYDSVIKKAFIREKKYRDNSYIPLPYTGDEPYVFISYAHKDRNTILPILSRMQTERCRIWFDDALKPGDNWKKIISSKIVARGCKNFVIFVSENSVESQNVRAEIDLALEHNLKIIPINLDGAKFDIDIAMYLNRFQYINYDENTVSAVVDVIDQNARILRAND